MYKKSRGGNGSEFKKGVLRRQTCAARLFESVTLMKSTSTIYYILAMEGKTFDVQLIPEFSGAATDMPIVKWVENVELVC